MDILDAADAPRVLWSGDALSEGGLSRSAWFMYGWDALTILRMFFVLGTIYFFVFSTLWTLTSILSFEMGEKLLVPLDMGLIAATLYYGWNTWVLGDLNAQYGACIRGFAWLFTVADAIKSSEDDKTVAHLLESVCTVGDRWLAVYRLDMPPDTAQTHYANPHVIDLDAALDRWARIAIDDSAARARTAAALHYMRGVAIEQRIDTRAMRLVRETQIVLFMMLHFMILLPLSIWLHTAGNFWIAAILAPLMIFIFLFRGIFRAVTGTPFVRNADAATLKFWESPFLLLEALRTRCSPSSSSSLREVVGGIDSRSALRQRDPALAA